MHTHIQIILFPPQNKVLSKEAMSKQRQEHLNSMKKFKFLRGAPMSEGTWTDTEGGYVSMYVCFLQKFKYVRGAPMSEGA
jgi:hypothetical protein